MIAAFLPQRLKKTKRRGAVELEADTGEPIETNKLLQKSSAS